MDPGPDPVEEQQGAKKRKMDPSENYPQRVMTFYQQNSKSLPKYDFKQPGKTPNDSLWEATVAVEPITTKDGHPIPSLSAVGEHRSLITMPELQPRKRATLL